MPAHPAMPIEAPQRFADATFHRVAWRFMPLFFLCYVVAYLDRVNVGFAKLQMLNDRISATRCTASGQGCFSGMVLYLTYWFPARRRGKMMAVLMAGNPVPGIIGGPVSGFIMHTLGGLAGHAGWQWLFIIEAMPAVILGVVIWFFLDDRVADATWINEDEKRLIAREISEDTAVSTHGSVKAVFTSGHVWLLCLILFGIVMGSYTIGFWQPTIINGSGVSHPFIIGLLTIIPYTVALVSMILVGRNADRTRQRKLHVIVPVLVTACGVSLCAFSGASLIPAMTGLTLATAGVITALPMFWALPTSFLSGAGAAAGIALVNSTGNLAGFVGPTILGWLKTQTHSLSSGLYVVAGSLVLSALLVALFIPARIVDR